MLRISIDGESHCVEEGGNALAVLLRAGHDVPHLCHDERLHALGGCRLCLVEVNGNPHPQASCTLTLADGMSIRTATPQLERLRRTNLALLTRHYPRDAVAREPDHPFHRLLARYGVHPGDELRAKVFRDDTHPYLGVDLDRCINCDRCVAICADVQGQFVWSQWQRGEQTRIAPTTGETLIEAGCVACGACADTCPTGALFDKRSVGLIERRTRSTCVYCGVGCQLEVGTRGSRVVAVRPADSPVNRGHLCVKGRYAFDFTQAQDRITTPLVRDGDAWREASWDEAFDYAADGLKRILSEHGPDAIGVLGSARATNEENYLAQKFARVVLGTNNVDCCARVCHTPSAKALKTMLGTGAATNSFDDIEAARTIMLCGCNPTENHPVVGARIKQAVRRGARLIVVDPRRIELADHADIHLAPRPGTNVLLFNAMAAAIIEEGLVDNDFIARRVDDFSDYARFVAAYAPERVAAQCEVPAATIRAAARIYASETPAMCFHGLGMTEHVQGTEGVMTLINLALLTGNLGVEGAGINPLRGQNNVQGAAHMGCDPATLPGGQSFADAAVRYEAAWGRTLPASHGLDLLSMVDAARAGKLKALWAFGYDVYLTLANASETAKALKTLPLVIVQDLFLNETARAFGHVFFPAASVFEREGTFMNADRRVQRVRAAIDAPGDAKPDWWIIQQLAARMGHAAGFDFREPRQIWNEIRSLWPAGAGLDYARLENQSLQWPCPDEAHAGTRVLHRERFAGGERATLARIDFVPTPEQCDDDYPLLLNTGRTLYHFNAGTMSYRTSNAALRVDDTLDMSFADAQRLRLCEGDEVRVTSRWGSAVLPLRVTDRVKPGELFATFHRAERFVNVLTSPYRDRQVHAPEYKVTAVRVERWMP